MPYSYQTHPGSIFKLFLRLGKFPFGKSRAFTYVIALFEKLIFLRLFQSWAFHAPVSAKLVPDYYNIVKNAMDLQTIKEVSKISSHFIPSGNLTYQL